MIRINYQSDFKLIEKNLNGDTSTPFRFSYRTVLSGCAVAEYDGHEYRNCRRLDDGSLLVVFDNHGLRPGTLVVKREYYLTDADFADGVCNLVSVEDTGVVLVTGRTDECEAITEVYPNYQKGDPMTWESMTEAGKKELTDAVVASISEGMVDTATLSDYEYEDVLSGFVPPEPPSEEDGETEGE